ncbi:hypothetical protein [Carnobacterium maltaromaticum]|uniref:hypothetical protein n=1 Tax=Carnobacterium maltaromaticum TaxID=2751 RepID=UPI00191BADE2|nr:hypothetical protein [Carnobacterium maltaromaticum]CAD5903103.1 conserved hypothetical protein [Carnobacterium maltaromaticum]
MENNNQTVEGKKNKKWILLILIVLGALASGYYFVNRSNTPVEVISQELLPAIGDASDRPIGEIAQEVADANYFTLNINPVAQFVDGSSEGTLQIINPDTNVHPIAVIVTLDETGEEVYASGAIQPNQEVNQAKLSMPLKKGQHQATATINIYDPDTLERQGATQAALTIFVEN